MIQLRRGSAAAWAATSLILSVGEPGWDKTNRILKIGDGVSLWADLDALEGPAGPAGPAGVSSLVLEASGTIGGHRAVIVNSLGQAEYADSTDMSHVGLVAGVTTNAAITGGDLTVADNIAVTEQSWNWTPNAPIFLSTLGQITQTPPTVGFSQILGVALTATSAFIRLREPIIVI